MGRRARRSGSTLNWFNGTSSLVILGWPVGPALHRRVGTVAYDLFVSGVGRDRRARRSGSTLKWFNGTSSLVILGWPGGPALPRRVGTVAYDLFVSGVGRDPD